MCAFSPKDDSEDPVNMFRELVASDKRSVLQQRYYSHLKEPKSIDELPRISFSGKSLPKKQLRRIVREWRKKLELEKYLVIIEEVSEWDYEPEYVETRTCGRLWVIDENGDRVETETLPSQLDAKRVEAGDFILIFIMFYLELWPSLSLRAYEENVLHEFLHVKHPDKSEKWIMEKTAELLEKYKEGVV